MTRFVADAMPAAGPRRAGTGRPVRDVRPGVLARLARAANGAHLGDGLSAGLTLPEAVMHFQLDDTVRVVHLLEAEREVTGSAEVPPQPRIGDTATIVADVGEGLYLVEHCTDDGVTVWMAELAAEEMELVERADGGR